VGAVTDIQDDLGSYCIKCAQTNIGLGTHFRGDFHIIVTSGILIARGMSVRYVGRAW
jgi:hypothetical protein